MQFLSDEEYRMQVEKDTWDLGVTKVDIQTSKYFLNNAKEISGFCMKELSGYKNYACRN